MEEAGLGRAADDEEDVEGVLGGEQVGLAPARRTGHPAPDADARRLHEQEAAAGRRVAQQFPRQGENGGMLARDGEQAGGVDRKSTRLNSSHLGISYAVF